MDFFSLKSIIDDILLIVRNNNISESEDLSRSQIASWVFAYKSQLIKELNDKDEYESDDEWADDSLQSVKGPFELEDLKSLDSNYLYTKYTKEDIPKLHLDSRDSIASVTDQSGHVIQNMPKERRHYHWHRKYTKQELTWYYANNKIYVQGSEDCNKLRYIWVNALWEDDQNENEDDVKIPGWMIPKIKKLIMDNELRFMLNRPSDDSNNATLASVKPHGPQDQEK